VISFLLKIKSEILNVYCKRDKKARTTTANLNTIGNANRLEIHSTLLKKAAVFHTIASAIVQWEDDCYVTGK
jgi:hypothetical protein